MQLVCWFVGLLVLPILLIASDGPLQLRLQMQRFLEEHFYLLLIPKYYNYRIGYS